MSKNPYYTQSPSSRNIQHKYTHYRGFLSPFELRAILILLRVVPPSVHIDAQQHWYRKPHHEYEEEERVADVACGVCYEADNEGPYERA